MRAIASHYGHGICQAVVLCRVLVSRDTNKDAQGGSMAGAYLRDAPERALCVHRDHEG